MAARAGTSPRCEPRATARRSRSSRATLIGGTCLNWGCIPTKALLASADALSRARAGQEYGFEVAGEIKPDFVRMMERKDGIVTRLRENVEVLLKKAGVEVLRGNGQAGGTGQGRGGARRGIRRRHRHGGGRQGDHSHGLGTGTLADVRLLATGYLDLY